MLLFQNIAYLVAVEFFCMYTLHQLPDYISTHSA